MTVRNRYQFILQCKEGVREDVSSSQIAISNAITCTHPAARRSSRAAGLHTGRSASRAHYPNQAGSSTLLSCLGRLPSGMRWVCWAGLRFRSPHARAHAPGQHTRCTRAQLQSARAPSAAAAAAAAAAGMLLLLLLLLLHPSPLEDPNLQGPHQSHAGARTPSCPRSRAALRTQLRNALDRHCLLWGRQAAAF